MDELTGQGQEQQKNQNGNKEGGEGNKPREELEQLMGVVKSLSDQVKELTQAQASSKTQIDTLIQEAFEDVGEGPSTKTDVSGDGEVDFDEMSPKQVVEYISTNVQKSIEPVLQTIQQEIYVQRVLNELDFCDDKYENFWENKDEVKKVAMENPQMSLEDAFLLVTRKKGIEPKINAGFRRRGHKPANSEKSKNVNSSSSKAKNEYVFGEKPSVSSASVKGKAPTTIREAAIQALEDLKLS